MRTTRAIIAGICLLLSGVFSAPAEEPSPKPLTLQECIDIALKNQVDLQAARNSVSSARARVTGAMSGYYPQIQVDAGTTTTGSHFSTGSSRDSDSDNAATVVYNLLDGGTRKARVRQSKANLTSAEESLQRTTQVVTFNITRNYFELLRAENLLGVADQQVKFAEGQRDLIRGRIESKDAAEADIFPVEAQLANARVSQLAARNRWRVAQTELQRSMGLTPTPGFTVADVTETPSREVPALEAALQDALKNRPDLRQAESGVLASRASVSLAKVEVYPQILANGRLNQELGTGSLNRNWSVFSGISFNLFDGGAARAGVRDAQAGLNTSIARREQLRKDIAAEVEEAILNLSNARERMIATEASLTAARKNLEAQEERYKLGLAIPLDLVNAQVAITTAQNDAIQALYDFHISSAQLDLALGK